MSISLYTRNFTASGRMMPRFAAEPQKPSKTEPSKAELEEQLQTHTQKANIFTGAGMAAIIATMVGTAIGDRLIPNTAHLVNPLFQARPTTRSVDLAQQPDTALLKQLQDEFRAARKRQLHIIQDFVSVSTPDQDLKTALQKTTPLSDAQIDAIVGRMEEAGKTLDGSVESAITAYREFIQETQQNQPEEVRKILTQEGIHVIRTAEINNQGLMKTGLLGALVSAIFCACALPSITAKGRLQQKLKTFPAS